MLIDKNDLVSALRIVDLVPTRVGIHSSEFIKLQQADISRLGIELTAEVIGKATFPVDLVSPDFYPDKGPFFVDRRVLMPFIMHESKVKQISLERKGKTLLFKYGRRKLSVVPITAITGYGGVKEADIDFKLKLDDTQKEMSQCAAKYAPQDNSLPQLQCVYFAANGVIVSSNSTSVFYGQSKKISKDIMFPIYLLSTLENQDLKEVMVGKKLTTLVFKNGTLTQTLPLQTIKGFPIKDLVTLAKKKDKLEVAFEVKAKRFLQVLSQFNIVVASNKDKTIKITGAPDGKVKVKGSASHTSFSDSFECTVHSEFACEWPVDAVLPFVEYAAKAKENLEVRFSESKLSPYYIIAGKAMLVISRKAN